MWERFTDAARAALFHAQEEAATVGEHRMGPEHLLLGLLRVEGCTASSLLDRLQVNPLRLRGDLERQMAIGPCIGSEEVTLSPAGKRVIERAIEAADGLGSRAIGTEHLLLALVADPAGIPARVLARQYVDTDELHRMLLVMAAENPGRAPDAAPAARPSPKGAYVPDEEFLDWAERTLQLMVQHARQAGQLPLLRRLLEETLAGLERSGEHGKGDF